MTSITLRHTSQLSRTIRRLASTQATTSSSSSSTTSSTSIPKPSLPPQKLRALVSLYHKSDTFLTPETLDAAIEKEFADVIKHAAYTEYTYGRLREDLDRRRSEPEVGRSGLSANVGTERWSDQSSMREKLVKTALYGLEDDNHAGLDVLLEERERIAMHRCNDQKS